MTHPESPLVMVLTPRQLRLLAKHLGLKKLRPGSPSWDRLESSLTSFFGTTVSIVKMSSSRTPWYAIPSSSLVSNLRRRLRR
jgi:hypothetical protein